MCVIAVGARIPRCRPILADFFGIEIRVLEQAAPENIFERRAAERSHSGAHGFFADLFAADLIRFHDGRNLCVAAELVYAVHDGDEAALALGHVFHIKAAACKRIHDGCGILRDAPVCANDTLKAVFFAQEIFDEILAVRVADVFAVFGVEAPRNRVVRHDGRGAFGGTV